MSRKKDYTIGIVLMLLGALFLLSNIIKISVFDNVLIIVGVVFLISYYFKRSTGYLMAGIILLAIGISEIIEYYNFMAIDLSGFTFLAGLGIVFLILYFTKKISSFIYPSLTLISVGIYTLIEAGFGQDVPWAFFLLLAISFYLMYFIETRKKGLSWPVIPGTALLLLSGLVYVTNQNIVSWSFWRTVSFIWPAILIVIGLKIVYNNVRNK